MTNKKLVCLFLTVLFIGTPIVDIQTQTYSQSKKQKKTKRKAKVKKTKKQKKTKKTKKAKPRRKPTKTGKRAPKRLKKKPATKKPQPKVTKQITKKTPPEPAKPSVKPPAPPISQPVVTPEQPKPTAVPKPRTTETTAPIPTPPPLMPTGWRKKRPEAAPRPVVVPVPRPTETTAPIPTVEQKEKLTQEQEIQAKKERSEIVIIRGIFNISEGKDTIVEMANDAKKISANMWLLYCSSNYQDLIIFNYFKEKMKELLQDLTRSLSQILEIINSKYMVKKHDLPMINDIIQAIKDIKTNLAKKSQVDYEDLYKKETLFSSNIDQFLFYLDLDEDTKTKLELTSKSFGDELIQTLEQRLGRQRMRDFYVHCQSVVVPEIPMEED